MRTGLVLAAACAAFLIVGLQSAAGAGAGNVTCTDFFAGTAYDLTLPADNFCELSGATITHDLIVESNAGVGTHDGVTVGHDAIGQTNSEFDATQLTIGQDLITQTGASLFLANTTVGRDLVASQPHTVQTGSACVAECESGPVKVGRDVLISGSPTPHAFAHDLCDMTVGRDLRVTDVTVLFGFTIGDIGPDEGCSPAAGNRGVSNTIGHDLVITGNTALSNPFFGPSGMEVDDNSVGHDLVFSGNAADPGGLLEVANNSVGHDATCAANSLPLSKDGPDDGPNHAGHNNSCG
jgi:hypothetical protein